MDINPKRRFPVGLTFVAIASYILGRVDPLFLGTE
jgi:hypothetical protein